MIIKYVEFVNVKNTKLKFEIYNKMHLLYVFFSLKNVCVFCQSCHYAIDYTFISKLTLKKKTVIR